MASLAMLNPSASAEGPEPLDANDGSNQLIRGSLAKVTLEAGEPQDMSLTTDGPGMLTVAWSTTSDEFELILMDSQDRTIDWQDYNYGSRGPSPVKHFAIPLGTADTYRVRLTSTEAETITIGMSWMPFTQMSGVDASGAADVVSTPQQVMAITPGQPQRPTIPAGDSDHVGAWLSYTPTEDGQLAILLQARAGDLSLSLFHEGNYQNDLNYVDSDMNGDTGLEGMVIDAKAGQTYYVRVSDLSENGERVRLRSAWLTETNTDNEPDAEPAPEGAE